MWFNGRDLPLQKLWFEFLCEQQAVENGLNLNIWMAKWSLLAPACLYCSDDWLCRICIRILTRCPAFVTVSWLSLSSFRHSISALLLSCLCRRILFNLYILAALHILGSLCVLRAPQDLVTLLSCPTCDWILLHFLFYMCNRILVHFCPIWATDLGSLCFCPTGVPGP